MMQLFAASDILDFKTCGVIVFSLYSTHTKKTGVISCNTIVISWLGLADLIASFWNIYIASIYLLSFASTHLFALQAITTELEIGKKKQTEVNIPCNPEAEWETYHKHDQFEMIT